MEPRTGSAPPLVTVMGRREAEALTEQVWRCYDAVFGDHDSYEDWFDNFWGRHLGREGFRLAVAVGMGDEVGDVVGFGWGYVGRRGQYFADLMTQSLPPELAKTWVGDSFEVVALGVLAGRRDAGLGRRLHDRLLDGVRRRCVLATAERPDNRAVRFYERLGWQHLGSLGHGKQLMGREPADES